MKNDIIVIFTTLFTLIFLWLIMSINVADADTRVPVEYEFQQEEDTLIMFHDLETDDDLEVPYVPMQESIYNPESLHCLAMNIYHEARGDSYAGKMAVSDVVLNRVKDSRYPNTICGVVYQGGEERRRCHFSWYCDGRSDTPFDDVSWQESQDIAKNILTNDTSNLTEGATHYHTFRVKPNWISDRGMLVVGRIGDHIFYRWERVV
tara:strand:- start:649 stop:1266 length:618 start_codon:yes stop_codon:yes gene_type:complete